MKNNTKQNIKKFIQKKSAKRVGEVMLLAR